MKIPIWKQRVETLINALEFTFPHLQDEFERIRNASKNFIVEDELSLLFEFIVDESARKQQWSNIDAIAEFLEKKKNEYHFLYVETIKSSPYLNEIVENSCLLGKTIYPELEDVLNPKNNTWAFLKDGNRYSIDSIKKYPTEIFLHIINHKLVPIDYILELLEEPKIQKYRSRITLSADDCCKDSDWHPIGCTTLVETFGLLPTFLAMLKHYDVLSSSEPIFLNQFFSRNRQRELRESEDWLKLQQIALHVLWFEERNQAPFLSKETHSLLKRHCDGKTLNPKQCMLLEIAFDGNAPFTDTLIPMLEQNIWKWENNTLLLGAINTPASDYEFNPQER